MLEISLTNHFIKGFSKILLRGKKCDLQEMMG